MPSLHLRFVSLLGFAFAMGLSTGCFKDGGGEGEDSGETGTCSEGSMGCDCYGNGTCDVGLTCSQSVCVPEGCDEGSLDCNCYGNQSCDTGLMCTDGVCRPEDSGETGTTTDTSTSDTSTSDTSTSDTSTSDTSTSDTSTSDTDTGESSSESVSTSISTSTSIGETGQMVCDELGDCSNCFLCATEFECAELWNECDNDCQAYVDCVLMCNGNGDCWTQCKNEYPNALGVGGDVLACTCAPCVDSCAIELDPICG